MKRPLKIGLAIAYAVVMGLSLWLNYRQAVYLGEVIAAPVYMELDARTGDVFVQVPYRSGRYVVRGMCRPERVF